MNTVNTGESLTVRMAVLTLLLQVNVKISMILGNSSVSTTSGDAFFLFNKRGRLVLLVVNRINKPICGILWKINCFLKVAL